MNKGNEMDDLQITRLCAQAMFWHDFQHRKNENWESVGYLKNGAEYDPLHDDSQAMALEDWLLERGTLQFVHSRAIYSSQWFGHTWEWNNAASRKRGLCECVAKMMQAAK